MRPVNATCNCEVQLASATSMCKLPDQPARAPCECKLQVQPANATCKCNLRVQLATASATWERNLQVHPPSSTFQLQVQPASAVCKCGLHLQPVSATLARARSQRKLHVHLASVRSTGGCQRKPCAIRMSNSGLTCPRAASETKGSPRKDMARATPEVKGRSSRGRLKRPRSRVLWSNPISRKEANFASQASVPRARWVVCAAAAQAIRNISTPLKIFHHCLQLGRFSLGGISMAPEIISSK